MQSAGASSPPFAVAVGFTPSRLKSAFSSGEGANESGVFMRRTQRGTDRHTNVARRNDPRAHSCVVQKGSFVSASSLVVGPLKNYGEIMAFVRAQTEKGDRTKRNLCVNPKSLAVGNSTRDPS
ncbi:hypothetical protein PBS_49830 [Paraburkholderia sp. 2C]